MQPHAVYCPDCNGVFQSDEDHCPSCGRRSAQGRRNLLFTMAASLFFVVAIASITFVLLRLRKAEEDAAPAKNSPAPLQTTPVPGPAEIHPKTARPRPAGT